MKSLLILLSLMLGYTAVNAQEVTKQEKGYLIDNPDKNAPVAIVQVKKNMKAGKQTSCTIAFLNFNLDFSLNLLNLFPLRPNSFTTLCCSSSTLLQSF